VQIYATPPGHFLCLSVGDRAGGGRGSRRTPPADGPRSARMANGIGLGRRGLGPGGGGAATAGSPFPRSGRELTAQEPDPYVRTTQSAADSVQYYLSSAMTVYRTRWLLMGYV